MIKNILKKEYLLETFDDENIDETNYIDESIKTDIEENLDEDTPKIEFIIEKNDNNEKQIRLNFEFKIDGSDEIIKLDIEISKNTYLEIADELID